MDQHQVPLQKLLFREGDLSEALERRIELIAERIKGIPRDQLMNTHIDELADHLHDVLLVTPLRLHDDTATIEQQEIVIEQRGLVVGPKGIKTAETIPGVRVTVRYHYSGHDWLWGANPDQTIETLARGDIFPTGPSNTGRLSLVMQQHIDQPQEGIKEWLDRQLATIRRYLDAQKTQVDSFNSDLRESCFRGVVVRRERIKRLEGLAEFLAIPLISKVGGPEVQPIEITRRLVRPLPPVPQGAYKPEPGVREDDYAHMLKVIRHAGRTFEAAPATFAKFDEPDLRNIVLAHLNTHYEGDATGETFRVGGKTDIRIEVENRAAFVAECKVWRGPKEISDAVNQLLGYLTWRDCKAAIVIFNKDNAKFTSILESIPAAFTSHRLYKRHSDIHEQGEWQFDMTSAKDEGRQVRVHVFVFNLFVR